MAKNVLIVVDMQKDFVDGLTGNSSGGFSTTGGRKNRETVMLRFPDVIRKKP